MPVRLVSLEAAKDHLNIALTDYSRDGGVLNKIELASAIIIDYLKSRAHNTGTIVSSSVGALTEIALDDSHTFTVGDSVIITDHEDSDPSLNGTWVIAAVTDTTFTLPVAVTTAGTGGVATVLWTEDTAPYPVQAAVLVMLTHLYEHRGDDMTSDEQAWAAVSRILMRMRDPAYA